MKRALLYKEWKKTQWFSLGILAFGALLLVYIFMELGRSFRFAGMEHLWDVVVNRDQFLFRDLKYFPLAAGVSLGLAQFIPEIIQKRIKLSLHLPMLERNIILLMLGYGQVLLLGIFVIHILGILIFSQLFFPTEILISTLCTIAPWYMVGFAAYSFIAMICLEPTWKRRVFNLILMLVTLKLYFLSDFPGAYSLLLCFFVIIPVYVLPFTFLSVYRFKTGEQD